MGNFTINFLLADSEYMTAVRLVVGAICSAADTDIDVAEDFKVCVTESCLILKSCGFDSVEIKFSTDGGVQAQVSGKDGTPKEGDCDFSLALVSALVASCDIEKSGKAIVKVILKI
jgi:hypothetical protein